jgi:hypothetical protein
MDICGYCEDCARWFDISLQALVDKPYQACPQCARGVAVIIDASDPYANPLYVRYRLTGVEPRTTALSPVGITH